VNLRNRLGLLFLSFLILVTISVVATAWMVNDQNQDALVINLAGRQRMLVHQMTSQALQIDLDGSTDEHQQILRDAEATFDQTLTALISGGETQYLPDRQVDVPATRSDDTRAELNDLRENWTAFRSYLGIIETSAPGSADFDAALQSVQIRSPQLVQQADDIVRLYEANSEHKLARLRWVQAVFFICAAALLVFGVILTRRDILNPLQTLKQATEQIGQGDLSRPVAINDPPELAALANSFDTMRSQLKTLTDGLEARVNQRTRELAALYDVIREISSHLDIEHVLESVTCKARDLLDSDVAFLCLLDGAGETLILKAYDGPQAAVCGTCALAKTSVAQQVLGHHQAMICDVGGCQTIAPAYRASHLAAPLRVGERVIGALCVGSTQPATYSEEQVRLLTELANSTAIALENARLFEQAERVATLEERQRIAADMHDGLAQTLSYVKLKTDQLATLIGQGPVERAAKELNLIHDAVDRATQEVRQSIASLRAAPVPDRPLQDQLIEFVTSFAASTPDFSVEVMSYEDQAVVLKVDEMAQILRVVQEALRNAHRHARATHVVVCFERQGANYQVIIGDNGEGFDITGINGKEHFGLNIMRARAAQLDGNLVIESAPGQGTRVILTWAARNTAAVV
jgi:two-component system nitrate/nitrite sensor histidine kinase NarX